MAKKTQDLPTQLQHLLYNCNSKESDAMVHPAAKLQMQLSESEFPFSKRMRNFFTYVGLSTVQDLTLIPLATFMCFRGFKARCRQELLAFIEFEGIEDLFEGFSQWKNDTRQPPVPSHRRQ